MDIIVFGVQFVAFVTFVYLAVHIGVKRPSRLLVRTATVLGLLTICTLFVGCGSGPQRTAVYEKDGNGKIVSGTETIVEKVGGEKVTTTNVLGQNGQVMSTTQTVVPDETKGELFGIYKGPSQYSSRPVYYNHGYGCRCSACCNRKPGRIFK